MPTQNEIRTQMAGTVLLVPAFFLYVIGTTGLQAVAVPTLWLGFVLLLRGSALKRFGLGLLLAIIAAMIAGSVRASLP